MDPKYLANISNSTFFSGISADDIPKILNCLDYKVINYKKNDYIVKSGEELNRVFIVLEGEAAVVKERYNGSRIVVIVFKAGDMFGETAAFAGGQPWVSTVQALTNCALMLIHPTKILNMCDKSCAFHRAILSNMVRVIAKKACDLNRKVEYLLLKSINGKLSKYLLEQSAKSGKLTFKLPLNREMLADFLNISRPSMSRELCAMRDKGIIDFYKDMVRIKDVERLKAMLEE